MRDDVADLDLRAALRRELAAAEAALSLSDSAQGVHRCRVALKRARALVRVARDAAPGVASLFNGEARAIMKLLAPVRDRTVLSDCARAEAKRARPKAAKALAAFAEALDPTRPPGGVEAAAAALKNLKALAQNWPELAPGQSRKGLVRLAKRARTAFQRADNGGAEARHVWRKREKDRLYAAELAGAAWPSAYRRRLRRARRLAQALGRERDVLLLLTAVKKRRPLKGGAAKAAIEHLKRVRATRAKKADRLGRRLHAGGA